MGNKTNTPFEKTFLENFFLEFSNHKYFFNNIHKYAICKYTDDEIDFILVGKKKFNILLFNPNHIFGESGISLFTFIHSFGFDHFKVETKWDWRVTKKMCSNCKYIM